MRKCKTCNCEIREQIRKHKKSLEHEKFLEKVIINKYVEKDIDVEILKSILNERINEHMEKFTNFTIMFCWKVNIIEYSITILKEEISNSVLNQESLDSILNRVFNQINIGNFEEFTLIIVSQTKKLTYRYYMNQPMEMIERKMVRRFFEGKDVNYKDEYERWSTDSVLHPKLNSVSRFRTPYSTRFLTHYLK